MIWILGFFTTLSLGSANQTPFPKNWCSIDSCSVPQQKIWTDFSGGGSPNWEALPTVFSGSCYHSSKNYDNNHEHFSGFIIDKKEDGFSFSGRHSFFVKENPYLNLNLKAGREVFKSGSANRIDIYRDYGFYNANPDAKHPVLYWFREGLDGKLKMAVVYGTLSYFILCDLDAHG